MNSQQFKFKKLSTFDQASLGVYLAFSALVLLADFRDHEEWIGGYSLFTYCAIYSILNVSFRKFNVWLIYLGIGFLQWVAFFVLKQSPDFQGDDLVYLKGLQYMPIWLVWYQLMQGFSYLTQGRAYRIVGRQPLGVYLSAIDYLIAILFMVFCVFCYLGIGYIF